jgi:hypothetical protein
LGKGERVGVIGTITPRNGSQFYSSFAVVVWRTVELLRKMKIEKRIVNKRRVEIKLEDNS